MVKYIQQTITIISAILFSINAVQAHEMTTSSTIVIEEKPGATYFKSPQVLFGQEFYFEHNVGNGSRKSGFTHYLEMRARASQNGPSPVKIRLRGSLHTPAVISFSGVDPQNNVSFNCTVKSDSKLYNTAMHAASNFEGGAILTVMRRIDDGSTGKQRFYDTHYTAGECFYIELILNAQYRWYNIPPQSPQPLESGRHAPFIHPCSSSGIPCSNTSR